MAGQGVAFSFFLWVSAKRVVSVRGGRPNGMVHLLVGSACSCGLPVFRQSLCWRVIRISAITALAGNGVSLITALAGNQCTIPFCRKREALCRKGGRYRKGRHWLVRTGLQNGIPELARVRAGGRCPFSDLLCTCGLIAHRCLLLLREGGSVWPGKASF